MSLNFHPTFHPTFTQYYSVGYVCCAYPACWIYFISLIERSDEIRTLKRSKLKINTKIDDVLCGHVLLKNVRV